MASGRGFKFGDASTDKVALYALIGLGIWVFSKVGAGLGSGLQGVGDLVGLGGSIASRVSAAVNGMTGAGSSTTPEGSTGVGGLDPTEYTILPGGQNRPPMLSVGTGAGQDHSVFQEPDGSLWEPYYGTDRVPSGATGGW